MFHDESWKLIYFGVRRSKVKATSHPPKQYRRGLLHSCECWFLLVTAPPETVGRYVYGTCKRIYEQNCVAQHRWWGEWLKWRSTAPTVTTTRIETCPLYRGINRLEPSAVEDSTASLFKKRLKMHFYCRVFVTFNRHRLFIFERRVDK